MKTIYAEEANRLTIYCDAKFDTDKKVPLLKASPSKHGLTQQKTLNSSTSFPLKTLYILL